ncbi:hypothetical protein [Haloferax volcanii]|uniref:Uncharacterized protein n=1 Tax=Haloferax volcanii TaxID=2246 RepID=A0A558GEL1_HALVO|nr:hypothetical protein [Haloferax volcanii]TVT96202.1 hypothetical protein FQA18_02375 [Haloferax volcanii]
MNRLTTLGVAFVVASLVFAGTVAAAGGLAAQTHASETVYATDGTAVRAPAAGTARSTGPRTKPDTPRATACKTATT